MMPSSSTLHQERTLFGYGSFVRFWAGDGLPLRTLGSLRSRRKLQVSLFSQYIYIRTVRPFLLFNQTVCVQQFWPISTNTLQKNGNVSCIYPHVHLHIFQRNFQKNKNIFLSMKNKFFFTKNEIVQMNCKHISEKISALICTKIDTCGHENVCAH